MEEVSAVEAARRLHISDKTVRKWLKNGRFPSAHTVLVRGVTQYAIGMEDIERVAREERTRSTGIGRSAETPGNPGISGLTGIPPELLVLPEQFAQLQQELTTLRKDIADLHNHIESLEQRFFAPTTTIGPVEDSVPVNPQEPSIGYEKRIPTRKNANPALPDGFRTVREFAASHLLAPTTVMDNVRKGNLLAEEGTWSVPGATGPVKYAFNLEQQRACLTLYREKITLCEALGCPCSAKGGHG